MSDDELPEPAPIWLALGIITWAVAASLAPTARARFIQALTRLTDEHEAAARLERLNPNPLKMRKMSHAIRVAVAWLSRLLDELRTARG